MLTLFPNLDKKLLCGNTRLAIRIRGSLCTSRERRLTILKSDSSQNWDPMLHTSAKLRVVSQSHDKFGEDQVFYVSYQRKRGLSRGLKIILVSEEGFDHSKENQKRGIDDY